MYLRFLSVMVCFVIVSSTFLFGSNKNLVTLLQQRAMHGVCSVLQGLAMQKHELDLARKALGEILRSKQFELSAELQEAAAEYLIQADENHYEPAYCHIKSVAVLRELIAQPAILAKIFGLALRDYAVVAEMGQTNPELWRHIRWVCLFKSQGARFPSWLQDWDQLRVLNVGGHRVDFFIGANFPPNIEVLWIEYCNLAEMPAGISRESLPSLRKIYLGGNRVEQFDIFRTAPAVKVLYRFEEVKEQYDPRPHYADSFCGLSCLIL